MALEEFKQIFKILIPKEENEWGKTTWQAWKDPGKALEALCCVNGFILFKILIPNEENEWGKTAGQARKDPGKALEALCCVNGFILLLPLVVDERHLKLSRGM